MRPRRSALYVPGPNARAIDKARALPADVVILDLEDAVLPEAKVAARAQVHAALAAGGFGEREVVVRVNGASTPFGQGDLTALAQAGAHALLLPKVECAAELGEAERVLDAAGAPPGLALWAMLETPRGVLAAASIAAAGGRLAALVAGTSDLTNELRARHVPGRAPLLPALGLVLLAARAYGLAALDGVFLDLRDEAGHEAACRQGRELGFDGKTLIHPSQIDAANKAFSPTSDELAEAREVVLAHEAARAAGKGVAVARGKLVEELHVRDARAILALADAITRRETRG
jgi:citrate lyase subunit beta/citryl-CoA lyase